MGIPCYLAMTGEEMKKMEFFPKHSGWMACHFSPYGTGLSNLPDALPPDSLLILNDRIPIRGHDPERICSQLTQCIKKLGCRRLLLDLQRPKSQELQELALYLTKALPCPVAVSEAYAHCCPGAVFLPSVPPSEPLSSILAQWTNREVWLELALDGEVITLTEQGAEVTPLPYPDLAQQGFAEETLHCHYQTELTETQAKFTLWRTAEDLRDLLKEAETLGITAAIGLYQELHSFPNVL